MIVATNIPKAIKTLNKILLVFFINNNAMMLIAPLIAPPIAPPTIGTIEQRAALFAQIKVTTKIKIAKTVLCLRRFLTALFV